MTLRLALAFTSALAGLAGVSARAATPASSTNHPATPLFAVLDTNHDGRLSEAELARASITLAALDLNGDGVITVDEWQATGAEGRARRPLRGITASLIVALDANEDGIIEPIEIANAATSLKLLDRNGDGQLTPDELRPTMVASAGK